METDFDRIFALDSESEEKCIKLILIFEKNNEMQKRGF